MNWAPHNHTVLTQLIRENGRGSPGYDPKRPPYAVFDWDQTSAFLDCGDVIFRYQLWNFGLRLSKDELRAHLQDEINGVSALAGAQAIKLADIHADIVSHYANLLDRRKDGLDALRATPEFLDFYSKMLCIYDAYGDTAGIGTEYSYTWALSFLANYSEDEIRGIARTAIRGQLADSLSQVTVKGPAALKTKAGPIETTYRTGLRVHPEMQELMASLRAAGIDVYVVSASLKQIVEVFAGPGEFGYGVPRDHVIGMELDVQNGRFTTAYKPGWVKIQKAGKTEAIQRVLAGRGAPILACGDSDGDFEMLSALDGTKVSLILNRIKGGKIGALCKMAAEERTAPRPRYLLQGRDENTGLFVPREETIPFGGSEARLLK